VARLLSLLAAGLLAQPGAAAPARSSLPGPSGAVETEAGTVSYDAARDRYWLEGGVLVRRGALTLRARAASYDPKTGEIEAVGGVLLTGPGRAVSAESLHLVLDGPYQAREVAAFFKGAPLDLSGSTTPGEAERSGRNRLTVLADRAEGLGERFTAEGARLTLCDCLDGPPSWEIRAGKADIIPGDRAVLSWPVLYLTPRFLLIDKPIPVLPLPWLYLPLSSRQTGFVIPSVGRSEVAGWALSLPLFVTLGRSYDATVTFDDAFGPGGVSTAPGTAIPASGRAVAGLGGSLELRWAPLQGTEGQAKIYALHDRYRYPGGPSDGWRIAATLSHGQRISDGAYLHADAALVNDPLYRQDFAGDLLLRSPEYLRSSLALEQRFADVLVELDAAYLQQIGTVGQTSFASALGQTPVPVPVVPFGLFGGSVPSFHRMPALSATLLPVRLLGPLLLSGGAGLARFAPLEGITDRSVNGVGPGERGWTGPAGIPGDTWTPGQRLAASRIAARAELRAPVTLAGALSVEPWLRGRAAGYAFADSARPAQLDGWGVAGVTLSTRLSRAYGAGEGRRRHDIEPRVEWRAGSGLAGPALPAYAYDEQDQAPVLGGAPCTASPLPGDPRGGCLPVRSTSAGPPGPWSQLRLGVRNRLVAPAGALSGTVLELDLGQDLDLSRGRLAETWARGAVSVGPVAASLLARFLAFGAKPPPGTWTPQYPSWFDAFTELRADLALSDRRGDNLHAGLLALGPGASASLKAGQDPLFDDRAVPFSPLAQGSAGFKVRVGGGLDLTYDALFNVRTVTAPSCGGLSPIAWSPHVQQHLAGLGWNSPCNCWRAALQVRISECGGLGFAGAAIDLGDLKDLGFLR
jgi:LPS-assembly protein